MYLSRLESSRHATHIKHRNRSQQEWYEVRFKFNLSKIINKTKVKYIFDNFWLWIFKIDIFLIRYWPFADSIYLIWVWVSFQSRKSKKVVFLTNFIFSAKTAAFVLLKRLQSMQPKVMFLTLGLLDMMMDRCNRAFHMAIGQKMVMQTFVQLLSNKQLPKEVSIKKQLNNLG